MKLLEINHVEKSFDDLNVLKDISLSVEDGEIVSIIGPSGSGKSTPVSYTHLDVYKRQGIAGACSEQP